MTKTVHPVLKKTGAVLLTVLVLVLMAVPAFAVALPDAPTGYVYDGANVLSSSTESYIERTGSALAEACGGLLRRAGRGADRCFYRRRAGRDAV